MPEDRFLAVSIGVFSFPGASDGAARASALDCAAHCLLIEFLGDHEQDRNGDGHQHRACAEADEPGIDVFLFQHAPQADGDREVLRIGTADDLCEHEVHPGCHERGDDLIHDHGLAQRQRDLGEDLPAGAAVQGGGLIQRLRDGIHKALHHEEAGTGTRREADDQCQRDAVALGHAQRLQDEVDGDHGHEAREQVQDHRHVHVRLAHLPLQAAGAVRHTQHEEGGDDAGAAGDEEGVHEHPGEVHDVKLREQRLVVVHGVGLGQEGRDELALAVTEGLHHQPEERDQPDDAQHDQEDIRNNIARHALGVHSAVFDFVRHYLNPSSSLYEPLER